MNARYCQQSEADLVQVPASSAVSRKPVPSGLGGLRWEPSGPPKPTAALPIPSAPACFLGLFLFVSGNSGWRPGSSGDRMVSLGQVAFQC